MPAKAASPMPPRTIGDWTVRCAEVAGSGESCEATQVAAAAGRPVAQIAIGRINAGGPLRMTLLLPLNASFSMPPRLVGYGPVWATPALAFAWVRCLPGGCIAVAEPPEETIRRFRSRVPPIRLAFQDGDGHEAVVQFSLTGLSRAVAQLAD